MSLTRTHSASQIRLLRAGTGTPLLIQTAEPSCRPFIHPVACPDGAGSFTEDKPAHHPWQRGLYVGLNKINGTSFWLGETSDAADNGTFHPQPLAEPIVDGNRARWAVTSEWQTRSGKALLIETQAWRFSDLGDRYELELDWTLGARTHLTFAEYPYGGLFLRMPWRAEAGGHVLTSEGAKTTQDAEGQRARWVAIAVPIPGRNGGEGVVAILDHPSNPTHPIPWRVDDGFGISPSRSILGDWTLASGESVLNRYLLQFSLGSINANEIEAAFNRFSEPALR